MRPLPLWTALCLSLSSALSAASPWRPFSDDSPWNTPIDVHAASDRDSQTMIDELAERGPWHINIKDWSIPLYFVDSTKVPGAAVEDSRPGVYGRGFEFPRSIPIPEGAQPSPPFIEGSDNHLCLVDRARNLEWGMWATIRDSKGNWSTGLGAVTDLSGTGVEVPWYQNPREFNSHRARAGGFPLIAGLIRHESIAAGEINHALAFAYDRCRPEWFIPPASTSQANAFPGMSPERGIPMGGRIQLDPTWDVEASPLSPAGKIIARALQRYGAYCSDYAGANVLYAENSPEAVAAWTGVLSTTDLETVFTPDFIKKHFRVIDMGKLLPGQNLTKKPAPEPAAK